MTYVTYPAIPSASPYGEPCQATDQAGRSCVVRDAYLFRHLRPHLVRREDGSFYSWWTQDEEG